MGGRGGVVWGWEWGVRGGYLEGGWRVIYVGNVFIKWDLWVGGEVFWGGGRMCHEGNMCVMRGKCVF